MLFFFFFFFFFFILIIKNSRVAGAEEGLEIKSVGLVETQLFFTPNIKFPVPHKSI